MAHYFYANYFCPLSLFGWNLSYVPNSENEYNFLGSRRSINETRLLAGSIWEVRNRKWILGGFKESFTFSFPQSPPLIIGINISSSRNFRNIKILEPFYIYLTQNKLSDINKKYILYPGFLFYIYTLLGHRMETDLTNVRNLRVFLSYQRNFYICYFFYYLNYF